MFKLKLFLKKNKAIVTFLILILLAITGYFSYRSAINNAIKPTEVPVAAVFMPAGSVVTDKDIHYITMPSSALVEGIYLKPEEIIGKIVNNQNSLAKDSLFYKEILKEKNEIKDVELYDLKQGEIAMSIEVNIETSYANSIMPGQSIDLYFSGTGIEPGSEDQKEKVVYGELVEAARVLAVYDEEGLAYGQLGSGDAAVIVVALSYENADLTGRAKHFGAVFPVVSYDSIHNAAGNTYYDMQKMKDAIYQRTIDLQLKVSTEGETKE